MNDRASLTNERDKAEGQKTFDFSDGKNNIDPRKVFNFLSNLLNVKVVVERLPDFTLKKYQRKSPTISNIALGDTKEDVTSTLSSSKLDTISYDDKRTQMIKIFSSKVVVEKLQDFTVRKYQANSISNKILLVSTSENVISTEYSNIDVVRHYGERIRKTDIQPTLFICIMCRKSFGRKRSLKSHMACCKSNLEKLPNRQELHGKGSKSDKIVTSTNSSKQAEKIDNQTFGTSVLTTRYCSKCKKSVEHDQSQPVHKIQHCKSCESALLLQCVKCNKRYRRYNNMRQHLKYQCNKTSTNDESSEPSSCQSKDATSRYCLKCKKSVGHDKFQYIDRIEHCESCNSRLLWQCNKCGKSCNSYCSMRWHFKGKCNSITRKKQPRSSPDHLSYRVVDLPNLFRKRTGIKELTKMYCFKCDSVVSNNSRSWMFVRSCVKCNATMQWQCIKCDKRYTKYKSIHTHLRQVCNAN